ncbi:microsomal dipeptidase-like Zn-dependent dipeptidase [Bradyrhizobium sp. USDA 4011]
MTRLSSSLNTGKAGDGALTPVLLKDASHLPNLIQGLRADGFDEVTLRKIAFDNWMRAFRRSWR